MNDIVVWESVLVNAADKGMDEFIQVFVDAIYKVIGHEITSEAMSRLNSDQITLLAYVILRDEVMDGGFIQLIHNGYGPFIFKNPFSKVMRMWGIDSLASMINKVHKLFSNYHEEIEKECTDKEFMALFEKYPAFDDFDDDFVENEEQWTKMVAIYIDENIDKFAIIKTMEDS